MQDNQPGTPHLCLLEYVQLNDCGDCGLLSPLREKWGVILKAEEEWGWLCRTSWG